MDPILLAKLRQKDESVNTRVLPKGATPVFPVFLYFCFRASCFPIFFVPRLEPTFHYTISPSTISTLFVFDSFKLTMCKIFVLLGGGGCCKAYGVSRSETAPSADLGGSRKYSNENFEE